MHNAGDENILATGLTCSLKLSFRKAQPSNFQNFGLTTHVFGLLKRKLSLLSEVLLAAPQSFTTALLLWAVLTQLR